MKKLIALIKSIFIGKQKNVFSTDDIYNFMESNKSFIKGESVRRWFLVDSNKNTIGYMWYKHLLGGWRLRLSSDKSNEWEDRGVIENVNQLKELIK